MRTGRSSGHLKWKEMSNPPPTETDLLKQRRTWKVQKYVGKNVKKDVFVTCHRRNLKKRFFLIFDFLDFPSPPLDDQKSIPIPSMRFP